MKRLIQQHAGQISGVLSGFDRMRFRGTLRWLAHAQGMQWFLNSTGVLLKEFKTYVQGVTDQVRAATERLAKAAGRPLIYLDSARLSKEEEARQIAEREEIQEGLICVFSAVEPCFSYEVRRNAQQRKLQLHGRTQKCLHYYFYVQHPLFGFMHLRLQTWFPLTIHIAINGREWLARQLDAAGLAYQRSDNCFLELEDPQRAQAVCDQQLKTRWRRCFVKLLHQYHPSHQELFRQRPVEYYWSLDQSEWASDVMFKRRQDLEQLYPSLLRHGMESFSSREVMRFLGRSVERGITPRFKGQVISDIAAKPEKYEGVRIKHRVNLNSVKMYNKAGSVLRVETTLNNMRDLQSPRRINGKVVYKRMRKGVADMPRRAQISEASNRRYLEAMAAVSTPLPLKILTQKLSRPTKWKGKRVRGLNMLGQEDAGLLEAVGRGEFLISGFRNRDLQSLLFVGGSDDPIQKRRRCGQITRKLRMLRAHGLIHKVPHTHRYMVNERGRQVIAALHAARQADVQKLIKAA